MSGLERLENFLKQLTGDVYPEPPGEPHLSITAQTVDYLIDKAHIKPGETVLDVGCGQGLALEHFKKHGLKATGIALGEDVKICVEKGYDAREMDLSFFDFPEQSFDFIWCRHSLEHSVFPLFTLTELHRMLRSGGRIYVEVPAPDTVCQHELNQNHYSVMGKTMWLSLFQRANLEFVFSRDIDFNVPAGPDQYWAFFLQKIDT